MKKKHLLHHNTMLQLHLITLHGFQNIKRTGEIWTQGLQFRCRAKIKFTLRLNSDIIHRVFIHSDRSEISIWRISNERVWFRLTYFNCQPCDETECLDLPTNCAELVKGPGVCNCCLVCARSEGESCGVNTPRCATGLECSPVKNNGPQATWSTFVQDKGVCRFRGMSTFSLKYFYWSKLRCQK